MSAPPPGSDEKQGPLQELIQPFIDLVHAPRALWGVNLAYMLEGLVYFGMLGYLAMHFSSFIFRGVPQADVHSHNNVMILTAGITISMFVLGFVADKWGVRFALVSAFILMLLGRLLISAAPTVLGLAPGGLWSSLHLTTIGGMFFVVVGYGMYQPAAYAAVRQFTTPKTAAMGFAMLYALMNLGGWLPSFAFLLRDNKFAGLGITGTFWVYTGITAVALISTLIILTRKTVKNAIANAKAETERLKAEEEAKAKAKAEEEEEEDSKEGDSDEEQATGPEDTDRRHIPVHLHLFVLAIMAMLYWKLSAPAAYIAPAVVLVAWIVAALIRGAKRWLAQHPLADAKFFFFIFALIPVQTLFTYNWLILPQYIKRSYEGWIGNYFEIAANANPLLIFVAVPIITALTQRAKVYTMMIIGTAVMAAPAFLLVIGPYAWTLFTYLLIMTIGEAMWQPRFLQYAAQIAPAGRTGVYMGVAQLPWFLTKMLVPWLYSGWMMDKFCPKTGEKNTELMWLIFGCIAITSTVMLIVAKGWVGKTFKESSD